MLKFQYDGREKIRIKTVNRVKNERMKIIKAQQKNKKNTKYNTNYKNSKSVDKTETDKIRQKMIESGQKSIELVKKRQRLNIGNFIEEQINRDLMLKTQMAKDRRIKAVEEENLKELERKKSEKEKKLKIQELKRQEELNRMNEENENKRKEMEENEIQRKNDILEEEKKNQIYLKNKNELENLKYQERKKGIEEENKKKEYKIRQKIW